MKNESKALKNDLLVIINNKHKVDEMLNFKHINLEQDYL